MGTFSSDSSEPPWELSVFFTLTEEQFWQKKCSTFLASSIVRSTQGGWYLKPRGHIISSFLWRWHYYNFYSEPSLLYDSHQNKKEVYWDESSLLLVTDKVRVCGCLMTGCTHPTKNKKTKNKTFDGACTTSWKLHSRNFGKRHFKRWALFLQWWEDHVCPDYPILLWNCVAPPSHNMFVSTPRALRVQILVIIWRKKRIFFWFIYDLQGHALISSLNITWVHQKQNLSFK